MALVRAGMEAVFSWLQQDESRYLNLRGADLRGVHFRGPPRGPRYEDYALLRANIAGADLRGAQFSGCAIKFVDLSASGTVFDGADFGEVVLRDARFRACSLRGVSFDHTNFAGDVDFVACDMDCALFMETSIGKLTLTECSLRRAELDCEIGWDCPAAPEGRHEDPPKEGCTCEVRFVGCNLAEIDLVRFPQLADIKLRRCVNVPEDFLSRIEYPNATIT